jgi:MFS family permease
MVDTALLRRNQQFRVLWVGYAINQLGSQLSVVAIAYQIYRLTGSSVDVGLVSLAQLVPAIIGPMLGGPIADAIDRRKLLFVTNGGGALCTVALAINASVAHPAVWPLYVFAALTAGFAGADNPARTAMMIALVDRRQFVSANALRTLMQQIAYVIGPSIAGLLLAALSTSAVFWVDTVSFGAAVLAVWRLRPQTPEGGGTRFGWQSIVDGVRYLKGRQAIQGCFVADLNATILGMPTALFPAMGLHVFHGGASTVGYLYAAPGAGAFLGALLSGWTAAVRRQGRAVLIAVGIWGVALTCFGLVPLLGPALVFLAIAGWADVVSAVFRSSIIQQESTDEVRGRLSAIQSCVVQVGPRLGNGEAGLVAGLGGTQVAVVSGGIGATVGIGLIGLLMPKFTHYRAELASAARGGEVAAAAVDAATPGDPSLQPAE